jgi:hypothetical protein
MDWCVEGRLVRRMEGHLCVCENKQAFAKQSKIISEKGVWTIFGHDYLGDDQ